jgi:hypothetical protein
MHIVRRCLDSNPKGHTEVSAYWKVLLWRLSFYRHAVYRIVLQTTENYYLLLTVWGKEQDISEAKVMALWVVTPHSDVGYPPHCYVVLQCRRLWLENSSMWKPWISRQWRSSSLRGAFSRKCTCYMAAMRNPCTSGMHLIKWLLTRLSCLFIWSVCKFKCISNCGMWMHFHLSELVVITSTVGIKWKCFR